MNGNERTCRNCDTPISEDVNYCPQCSQKNTDGKIPVWTFLKEFFSNLLNIDSKLFLTFYALFIPGKLTVEYFKGKHKSYANPVRLFLFAGITLFAVVIAKTDDIKLGEGEGYYIRKVEQMKFKNAVDEKITDFQTTFQDTSEYYQSDSLKTWIFSDLNISTNDDSIRFASFKNGNASFGTDADIKISAKDFVDLPVDSIMRKYETGEGIRAMIIKQQIRTRKNGRGVFHYFIGKLPIMIFFMMPFLALILKVLYARHNYYFVEHLVLSFHVHTFAFLVTLLLVLLGGYFHGLLIAALIVSIFIYEFMAMKKVYQQGFWKTTFKFILLNFSYMFLVIFFFVLAVGFSFFMF